MASRPVLIDHCLQLGEELNRMGLKAKAEVGIPLAAGAANAAEELEAEGTRDPGRYHICWSRREWSVPAKFHNCE